MVHEGADARVKRLEAELSAFLKDVAVAAGRGCGFGENSCDRVVGWKGGLARAFLMRAWPREGKSDPVVCGDPMLGGDPIGSGDPTVSMTQCVAAIPDGLPEDSPLKRAGTTYIYEEIRGTGWAVGASATGLP